MGTKSNFSNIEITSLTTTTNINNNNNNNNKIINSNINSISNITMNNNISNNRNINRNKNFFNSYIAFQSDGITGRRMSVTIAKFAFTAEQRLVYSEKDPNKTQYYI